MGYLVIGIAILVCQALAVPTPVGESRSCYSCRFTGLDGTCNHTQTCSARQGACITQVSYAEEDIWVTRACARLTICANAEENNADECYWENPQTYGYEGKCSFCCSGDNCNSFLPENIAPDSTQEDTGVEKESRKGGDVIQPRPGGHTKPGGTTRPKPGGSTKPKPGGTTRPKPGGTTKPKPGGTTRPKPGGTTRPKPSGTTRPKPGGTTRPKPCPICPNTPQHPNTRPPATNPPATKPPATNPPATKPPATNPPATKPPATNPPATKPPATNPPATNPPTPCSGGGNNSPCHCHGNQGCCRDHGGMSFDIDIKVHVGHGGTNVVGQTGGSSQTVQIQTGANTNNTSQISAQASTTQAPPTTTMPSSRPTATSKTTPAPTAMPSSTASTTASTTTTTQTSPHSATTSNPVPKNSQPSTIAMSTDKPTTTPPTSTTASTTSTTTTTPTTTSSTTTVATTTTPTTTSTPPTTKMSTTAAVVTKKMTVPTTSSGSTKPPFSCYTCKKPDCSQQTLQRCSGNSRYCMTTVQQHKNGERKFTKGCVTKNECEVKWWKKTAISSECIANMDDSTSGLPDMAMQCSFCCTASSCNEHTQPTNRASWYIGDSLPPIPGKK